MNWCEILYILGFMNQECQSEIALRGILGSLIIMIILGFSLEFLLLSNDDENEDKNNDANCSSSILITFLNGTQIRIESDSIEDWTFRNLRFEVEFYLDGIVTITDGKTRRLFETFDSDDGKEHHRLWSNVDFVKIDD